MELYFNNILLISGASLWAASKAELDFTSGSCVVAAKITNTDGDGKFIARQAMLMLRTRKYDAVKGRRRDGGGRTLILGTGRLQVKDFKMTVPL